jgi:transcriptional regulator with XRE-family HTH domain
VSQIENGVRNPSAVTLQKLAGALDAEVTDFFPKVKSHSSQTMQVTS